MRVVRALGAAICAVLVTLCTAHVVKAGEPAPFPDRLGGDWGSLRTGAAERGLTFRLESTHSLGGMISGTGDKEWDLGGRLDGFANVDTGRLGLWRGGLVRMHGEYFYGSLQPDRGGVLMANNVGLRLPNPGTYDDFALTSLHLVQQLGKGRSLIVGAINTPDLLESHPFYGGGGWTRFQNLAFVAPPNGLIPPVMMGAILNVFTEPVTWTFMVFDPEDRTRGGWFDNLFDDVSVSVTGKHGFEIARRTSSVAVNGIYTTQDGIDLGDVLLPPGLETDGRHDSWHFSVQFEHDLRERPVAQGSYGLFVKLGVSDGNPNPFQAFISGGIGGRGLFENRPDDRFGLGYYYYDLSDDLQDALNPLLAIHDEQGVEIFYDFPITPWLRVGANLQYADPALGGNSHAFSAGVRARLSL